MQRHDALLYAQTSAYRTKLQRARDSIAEALAFTPSWYVSVSGGKDSTCVRSLVLEQQPSMPCVAYVQKWMLPETVVYLKSLPALTAVASRDIQDAEYHDQRWRDEEEARAVWPSMTWLESTGIAADQRYGRQEHGAFLGLRADESRGRRMNARTRGACYWNQTSEQWIAQPIAHWSVLDVWAYILTEAIPYNAAYDVLDRLGVPLERQRVAEFMIDRVMSRGTLATLKRGWPEVFNRFVIDHPEARNYV